MAVDKWIVLIVGVGAIIALNVNFIRRMNRRDRDAREARALREIREQPDDHSPKE